MPFQLSVDGGIDEARRRLRELPRRPVHPDLRVESHEIDGPGGPIPVRVYWPDNVAETRRALQPAGHDVLPRRRLRGRRPRHPRRDGPRTRRGRTDPGGVGRLPAGARASLSRGRRRRVGRHPLGGRQRRSIRRRRLAAGGGRRLGRRHAVGGGRAAGPRPRRAAAGVPAALVPVDDVGHLAAVVRRERRRTGARQCRDRGLHPLVCRPPGPARPARRPGAGPCRRPVRAAAGLHRGGRPRPAA